MKRSQLIGGILALVVIIACFMPWSIIESRQIQISGMNTTGTHFGKPGIIHIFFCSISIILFAIQRLWSKRANIFLAAMNLAWCIRNFILISICAGGECQDKQIGIYILLVACSGVFLMTLLPKITLKQDQ